MKGIREPGWWTFGAMLLTLICQAFAFQKLTERDLAGIRQSLDRIETRMLEQDREITKQKERLLRLEWDREVSDSIDDLSREVGRPTTTRPPYRTRRGGP